ncbi:MAG: hypothetical protein JSR80_06200 [Verrucomicrobia bacterium]|nr:hypothetical protein [Verrucomicrobiota bacterium]
MKKLTMRAALAAAGLLLFGASPQVAADNCCNPCNNGCWDPCTWGGDFEFGAHALLFQPSTCRFDFAERVNLLNAGGLGATIPNTATVGTIDPELHWGFRVWGDYIQDCLFAGVGYQWFEGRDTGRLLGAFNTIMRDNTLSSSTVDGRLYWRYQNVDLRIGAIQSSCHGEVYGFINGRWIDLEHTRNTTSVRPPVAVANETDIAKEKAQFQGGALGIGVGGRRNLLCNFGVIGELNILGVIGKRQTTATFFTHIVNTDGEITNTLYDPGYKSVTNVTPEIDLRIGLDYTWCCNCWMVIGEVGYELDYFWNVFDFPNALNSGLTNRTSGTSWKNGCEDVGFSGLFFGLRTLF